MSSLRNKVTTCGTAGCITTCGLAVMHYPQAVRFDAWCCTLANIGALELEGERLRVKQLPIDRPGLDQHGVDKRARTADEDLDRVSPIFLRHFRFLVEQICYGNTASGDLVCGGVSGGRRFEVQLRFLNRPSPGILKYVIDAKIGGKGCTWDRCEKRRGRACHEMS